MPRRALAPALALLLVACGDDDGPTTPPDAGIADAPVAPPDAAPPDAIAADAPPFPPGASCGTAIAIATDGTPRPDTTSGAANLSGASCSGGTDYAPDRYFVVDVGETPVDLVVDVLVEEAAPMPFDAVVSARADCADPMTELGCVDHGRGERLELLAVTGTIYLIIDGTAQFMGVAQGSYTLTVATRAIVGMGDACDPAGATSRCDAGRRCEETAGTCVPTSPVLACMEAPDLTADLAADGVAEATGTVHAFDADDHQGACAFDVTPGHPERLFRFTLAAPATVTASTDDPATTYDTVLYLRGPSCDAPDLECADDVDAAQGNYRSTLVAPSLAAGTYVLVVDAASGWRYGPPGTPRTFKLTLTATP